MSENANKSIIGPTAPDTPPPEAAPKAVPRRLSLPDNTLAGVSGAQKALLFLVSLDESIATRVLGNLSDEHMKQLRSTSESMIEASPRMLTAVHRDFLARVRAGAPKSLRGSNAYLRRLAGNALGEGRAAELWSDAPVIPDGIAELARLQPTVLATLLEEEQAQTAAVVLSQLPPARASEVLALLPAAMQSDVVLRLARLESVPETVLKEIERAFAGHLRELAAVERREIKGAKNAADIVKRLPEELSQELLGSLRERNAAVAEGIEKEMFTFEDLARIDSRGLQLLLKEIPTDQLVLALKTASDQMKEKIFGNVSSRAGEMLREELDLLGPVRVSDVEAAQLNIVQTALDLEREGRVQIAREGVGNYV